MTFRPLIEDDRINAKDRKFLLWVIEGSKIFSTCSAAQYMAIVVDKRGRVVGSGYNGGPPGYQHCNDGGCPHALTGTPGVYDDCIAIHAEENALMYSDFQQRFEGTLYVNGRPCLGCSRKLAGSGLARVVYFDDGRARKTEDFGFKIMYDCGMDVVRWDVGDLSNVNGRGYTHDYA